MIKKLMLAASLLAIPLLSTNSADAGWGHHRSGCGTGYGYAGPSYGAYRPAVGAPVRGYGSNGYRPYYGSPYYGAGFGRGYGDRARSYYGSPYYGAGFGRGYGIGYPYGGIGYGGFGGPGFGIGGGFSPFLGF